MKARHQIYTFHVEPDAFGAHLAVQTLRISGDSLPSSRIVLGDYDDPSLALKHCNEAASVLVDRCSGRNRKVCVVVFNPAARLEESWS